MMITAYNPFVQDSVSRNIRLPLRSLWFTVNQILRFLCASANVKIGISFINRLMYMKDRSFDLFYTDMEWHTCAR